MTSTPGTSKDATSEPDDADDLGDTHAAGAGLSDDEFAERVAGQTSNDLQAQDVFEREADGTSTDEPVADVTGDDLKT